VNSTTERDVGGNETILAMTTGGPMIDTPWNIDGNSGAEEVIRSVLDL
jgi:hypothetical protein